MFARRLGPLGTPVWWLAALAYAGLPGCLEDDIGGLVPYVDAGADGPTSDDAGDER